MTKRDLQKCVGKRAGRMMALFLDESLSRFGKKLPRKTCKRVSSKTMSPSEVDTEIDEDDDNSSCASSIEENSEDDGKIQIYFKFE